MTVEPIRLQRPDPSWIEDQYFLRIPGRMGTVPQRIIPAELELFVEPAQVLPGFEVGRLLSFWRAKDIPIYATPQAMNDITAEVN